MYRYLYKDLFRENELIHVKQSRHAGVEGEHTHEFVELVYILSGNGKHFIDNKCYEVGKGSLLFINWLNYFVYQSTPYDLKTLS